MKTNRKTQQQKPPEPRSKDGAESTEQRSRVTERRAAEADSAPLAIPGDDARSMTVPVTRHAPFSEPGEWQFLACNADTLDLGVFVQWGTAWERLQPELEKLKEAAYGTPGVLWGNGVALVLPTGKPPQYRYHLKFPDFELYIGIQDAPYRSTPNVYVSLSAKLLWHRGIAESVGLIWDVVRGLGGHVLWVQPSRVDLTADFHVPGGLELDFLRAFRVPAKVKMIPYLDGDLLETLYVGEKKSPIQLRIYHKSLEITRNPLKAWMHDIWGLENPENVWRVEFQIRRQLLRETKIASTEDLVEKTAGLWEYLTGKWFSLRLQDNPNSTRRTVHPFWRDVQNVAPHFGTMCAVTRERPTRLPDVSRSMAQIYGNFISMSAMENRETQDEAIAHLLEKLLLYCRSRNFEQQLQCRRIKFGQDIREQRDEVIETEFP